MIEMTLQMAETAVRAAQEKAKELGTPMTVTVVDEAGRLVLTARGDNTGFFSTDTSRAKAMASAAFKRSNTELNAAAAQPGFWQFAPTVLQGQLLPTLGATPIVRNGQVIGAIGCGGGTGQQDQDCAEAGAAAVAAL